MKRLLAIFLALALVGSINTMPVSASEITMSEVSSGGVTSDVQTNPGSDIVVSGASVEQQKALDIAADVKKLKNLFLNSPGTPPDSWKIKSNPQQFTVKLDGEDSENKANNVTRFELFYSAAARAQEADPIIYSITDTNDSVNTGSITLGTSSSPTDPINFVYKDGGVYPDYPDFNMAVLYIYNYDPSHTYQLTLQLTSQIKEFIMIKVKPPTEDGLSLKEAIRVNPETHFPPRSVITWYTKTEVTGDDNTISPYDAEKLFAVAASHFTYEDVKEKYGQSGDDGFKTTTPVDNSAETRKLMGIALMVAGVLVIAVLMFLAKKKAKEVASAKAEAKRVKRHAKMKASVQKNTNVLTDVLHENEYSDDDYSDDDNDEENAPSEEEEPAPKKTPQSVTDIASKLTGLFGMKEKAPEPDDDDDDYSDEDDDYSNKEEEPIDEEKESGEEESHPEPGEEPTEEVPESKPEPEEKKSEKESLIKSLDPDTLDAIKSELLKQMKETAPEAVAKPVQPKKAMPNVSSGAAANKKTVKKPNIPSNTKKTIKRPKAPKKEGEA